LFFIVIFGSALADRIDFVGKVLVIFLGVTTFNRVAGLIAVAEYRD
jgi:hypothetical protein